MLDKLQKKWKVTGTQFWLIISTFAVTGTTTAWITRKITDWAGVVKYSAGWWILKIFILLIGYQLLILFFGFLFGQFRFFWNYEKKILRRLGFPGLEDESPVNLAVFASGRGSNFEKIIDYFHNRPRFRISVLVSNNGNAGAHDIARKNHISSRIIQQKDLTEGEEFAHWLKEEKIDYIILAGFLKKIPQAVINAYRGKILNLHPALLPKFGGKGMYGLHVHEAVIAAGEKQSGITIHLVDEEYDNGDIIFQTSCPVLESDTPESLAEKIHLLEHTHFPEVIEKFIEKQNPR